MLHMHICPQEVNVYTERMGYEKFSVYCPYWMVNKTGLTLEYKVLTVSIMCTCYLAVRQGLFYFVLFAVIKNLHVHCKCTVA